MTRTGIPADGARSELPYPARRSHSRRSPLADLLVVCTANLARSPLAEVLLRAHADDSLGPDHGLTFGSAGLEARDGYPAVDHSQTIARRWGLDLTLHRSRRLRDDLVQQAAIVLTMSTRHRDVIGTTVVGAASRTFALKEFVRLAAHVDPSAAPDDPAMRLTWAARAANDVRSRVPRPPHGEDITDPFGGPFDGYVDLANALVPLSKAAADVLFRPPSVTRAAGHG